MAAAIIVPARIVLITKRRTERKAAVPNIVPCTEPRTKTVSAIINQGNLKTKV